MIDNFYIDPNKIEKYIPIRECKDSCLYIINARNSNLGIYNKKDCSFTISRVKFSSNFLFDEFHWDTGAPYGTVKPLKELHLTNLSFSNDDEKLRFLNASELLFRDEIKILFKTNIPF